VKTITFEFRVENTSTCDAVAFITKSLAGDPDIAVSFHNTTSTPNFGNADYISTQIGTYFNYQCLVQDLVSKEIINEN
jgi:hypothetical protein